MILDASAILELLLGSVPGRRLAQRLRSPEIQLHAPHLVDLEVAQAICRYVLSGHLSEQRGHVALQLLVDLDLERHPHDLLLPRIWALRENLTAYDAAYVALAEVMDAPLVTTDRRLAAAPGTRARIELL